MFESAEPRHKGVDKYCPLSCRLFVISTDVVWLVLNGAKVLKRLAAFSKLLGNLHEVSYIYVQDVRAAACGYGGRTQEHRYHHPH